VKSFLLSLLSDRHIGAGEESMLLSTTAATGIAQDRSCARWALLSRTIEFFHSVFPSITIRLLDHVSAVNAQASRSNGESIVDIFGGLAFHPAIGADALKFSLLHEIGHHLGCGARMTPGSPLACDCAADHWAILQGLPAVARINTEVNVGLAMNQLENALPLCLDSIEAFSLQNRDCWCWDWPRRRHYLSTGAVPTVDSCSMFSRGQIKF
jgi:hypothetical protein